MKKLAVLIAGTLLLMNAAFAGGILTNTNQSAQFVRMLSRNASTDLDAVYFNPAGLTQLDNGFYFGLHNQTIFQNRTISSEFPLLHNSEYKGEVFAPVFPSAFAVYKLNNWAFSAGFGPNGGGGSAKYDTGLPSFEKQIASLVPALAGLSALGYPVADYGVDISFEGTSVFWGIQAGATYKINDVFSVFGGARYLPSVNTYNGGIANIEIGPAGALVNAQTYLTSAAQTANQYGQTAQATMLLALSAGLGDKRVDVKQTGAGITPIIGFNIHLEKLNVGLKYEHMTTLILTNSPSENDNYSAQLFPEKFGNDIPAIISVGADYMITDALKISGSFNEYMDKWVGWGNNVYGQHRSIDKNYMELALGVEYNLTEEFAVSAGYMNSNTGVSEQYQSDFSYSNDSYTAGVGVQWNINDRMVLDAGMMLTTYKDETKTFDASFDDLAKNFGTYTETYGKDTFTFAFGLGYKIAEFKSKRKRR